MALWVLLQVATRGSGAGGEIAAVLGGAVGSVVGAKIEEARTRASGREYTIRLENGEVVSVFKRLIQRFQSLRGDDVKLLSQKGSYRVTRLNTAGRR